jgi:dihydrofolate synthase/folylpolyglutamate synthase
MSIENNEQYWTNVDQAINWIHSLLTLGMKPGLKRMEWMLERLNHPQRRLHFIHVGGTNGKGSTVSFLSHVLQTAGYEVGTFTSPYIERFQDRIKVNGHDISNEDLLQLTRRLKPLADQLSETELGAPTEFEVVTMLGILYFATIAYPDYVIWEVGLGGRLDSTNVVVPILSIITNVGYDHIHILGSKIEEIAFEKAGIIKSGVPVVTGTRDPNALKVIEDKAKEKRASFYQLDRNFHAHAGRYNEHEQFFSYESMFTTMEDLCIGMQGKHQVENASIAIMALEVLKQYYAVIWDEEHLREGLRKTTWIGRMEKVNDHPLTILDGAHNPEGIEALAETMQQYYPDRPITVIFSAMKDKDLAEMMKHLNGKINKLILTQFDYPRAASVAELMKQVELTKNQWNMEVRGEPDWKKAYEETVQGSKEHEVIFITGSLYFISEVRQSLKK